MTGTKYNEKLPIRCFKPFGSFFMSDVKIIYENFIKLDIYPWQHEFENSDFIYMLNQAAGDRQILSKQLGISPHQLSYVTQSNAGEGLLFYGDVIIPFVDRFPKDTELYSLLNTRPSEQKETG